MGDKVLELEGMNVRELEHHEVGDIVRDPTEKIGAFSLERVSGPSLMGIGTVSSV